MVASIIIFDLVLTEDVVIRYFNIIQISKSVNLYFTNC